MARPKAGSYFSIAQLESFLESRRAELGQLQKQHAKLQDELGALENKIAALGGKTGGKVQVARTIVGAGTRPRNVKSLVESLEEVLGAAAEPMKVGDIVNGVLKSGYRTSSDNFRGIVNQTLIKERKRFAAAARGLYMMKGRRA